MSEYTIVLLKRELVNVEDNLCRAKIQKRCFSEWKSGNGQSIESVIAGYEAERQKIICSLAELGAKP